MLNYFLGKSVQKSQIKGSFETFDVKPFIHLYQHYLSSWATKSLRSSQRRRAAKAAKNKTSDERRLPHKKTGEEVILIKDRRARVTGFDRLSYPGKTALPVRLPSDTIPQPA